MGGNRAKKTTNKLAIVCCFSFVNKFNKKMETESANLQQASLLSLDSDSKIGEKNVTAPWELNVKEKNPGSTPLSRSAPRVNGFFLGLCPGKSKKLAQRTNITHQH